jgi:putative transposase
MIQPYFLLLPKKNMAAGSFNQLFIHLVFSPHLHSPIQSIAHQELVFKFLAGLINSMGSKSLAVNGMYDHVHIFFGWRPKTGVSIPDVVKELKRASTNFIKQEDLLRKFAWQNGYGSFSYSMSHVDKVIDYIINQREHHKNMTFRDEYIKMLTDFQVTFDEKYLFDFHEWQRDFPV